MNKSEKLARLLRIQAQINKAGEARLASLLAEDNRLSAELEQLDELAVQDSMTARLFPDICAKRSARIADLRNDNAAERRNSAREIAVGNTKRDVLERRLEKSVRAEERKRQEKEFADELSRTAGAAVPASRKA